MRKGTNFPDAGGLSGVKRLQLQQRAAAKRAGPAPRTGGVMPPSPAGRTPPLVGTGGAAQRVPTPTRVSTGGPAQKAPMPAGLARLQGLANPKRRPPRRV